MTQLRMASIWLLLMLLSACNEETTIQSDPDPQPEPVTPAVSAAIATSNKSVFVSFSKPMSNSALNAGNYVITQETINTEVGTLTIDSAAFVEGSHSDVILQTSPQSEVTYRIKVAGISDRSGTPVPGLITTPSGIVDTSSTTFAGGAPEPETLEVKVDETGAITGWSDFNENGVIDAGDALSDEDGNQIIITDSDGNGVPDEWIDTDGSGTVNAGDTLSGFADSDGDGLSDAKELFGNSITVTKTNGSSSTVEVTSNPLKADTDGDGLDDRLEYTIDANPRSKDTDSDGINDNTEWNLTYSDTNNQDTDGDSLSDGLEYSSYKTSLLLADSDGDKLTDDEELFELNRDPLIADIPRFNIEVSDIRLQLDERLSYTDESGTTVSEESSTETTLAQSDSRSYTETDNTTEEWTVGASIRAGIGTGSFFGGDTKETPAGGVEVTAHGGYTNTHSFQTDTTSAEESQQTYASSVAQARELSTTSTVDREVIGASIDINLSISNIGNIPFTISNLEITVLQQTGIRDTFLPVATLVAQSELTTGTPLSINLGGGFNEKGPFIFTSREAYPNLVEALMRKPDSLVFRVANYDVSDELGRNYAFSNQVARDRTASITMDYGDKEAAEEFLTAIHGTDADGVYLGGFNADGSARGLPLSYVMESILGLPRHDSSQDRIVSGDGAPIDYSTAGDDAYDPSLNIITAGDNGWLETRPQGSDFITNPTGVNGIIAGLNKTADSIAQGDDIQLVPVNSNGLSIGTVVIDPGDNGVLDTPAQADDIIEFTGGYETSRTCSVQSANAGSICRIDDECGTGTCSGPEKLVRVGSLRDGDYNRGWYILTSGNLPDAADFDKITVEPGDNLSIAFLQDLDGDGIFARNEFLFGSTDSNRDQYNNALFGPNFSTSLDQGCQSAAVCDGIPDSVDTDRDGLSDYAETFVGWKVAIDGGSLRQTFSSPRFPDTDGDTLPDAVEQDLRQYCVASDTRSQGLCAFQTEAPVAQEEAIGIIAGSNGIADTGQTALMGDDVLLVTGNTNNLSYGTPVISPGDDGVMQTAPAGDDVYESAARIPPATDPTLRDSDMDYLSDDKELDGFAIGIGIFDGGDETVDTQKQGDDIQRVFAGNPIQAGGLIIQPGPNGAIESIPGGDDTLCADSQSACAQTIVTDPLRRDTDDDIMPDGFELTQGSDPTVDDQEAFGDLDLDGLSDSEETSLGWLVSVNGAPGYPVKSSPSEPDSDYDGLADYVERDLRTDPNKSDTDGDGLSDYEEVDDLSKYQTIAAQYPNMNITSSSTGGLGTDPTLVDTDGDGLSDKQEAVDGISILLPGGSQPTLFFTNPLKADTDYDGLLDLFEQIAQTDPTNNDTDGDGRSDGDEFFNSVSDPRIKDLTYKVALRDILANSACKDASDGADPNGELMWWVTLTTPDGNIELISDALDAEKFDNNVAGSDTGAMFYPISGVSRAEVPDGTDSRACYYKETKGVQYWLDLGSSSDEKGLKAGESFTVRALFVEADGDISSDCGLEPSFIPTSVQSSTAHIIVRQTYRFEDLNGGQDITLTSQDGTNLADSSSCELDFQIDVDVIQ